MVTLTGHWSWLEHLPYLFLQKTSLNHNTNPQKIDRSVSIEKKWLKKNVKSRKCSEFHPLHCSYSQLTPMFNMRPMLLPITSRKITVRPPKNRPTYSTNRAFSLPHLCGLYIVFTIIRLTMSILDKGKFPIIESLNRIPIFINFTIQNAISSSQHFIDFIMFSIALIYDRQRL